MNINKLINEVFEEEIKIPEGLSERLEKNLDNYIYDNREKKTSNNINFRKLIIYVGSLAASILLCVGLFFIKNDKNRIADTFQDPVEAEMFAVKMLTLVSTELNKGITPYEKVNEKVNRTNEIINKNLTIK
jgi:hypothetical protein